jgi:3-deoxy-D-manno-octulosonic-acid transferase
VGEVNATLPLLRKLRTLYPDLRVFLSTITDTGQKVAMERAPEGTTVIYLPFDAGFILKRCLEKTRPKIFVTIETELWPNIFRILAGKGVPVMVLNGRISEKSARGYKKISFFMKRVFECVELFGMQSQVDAERLTSIGADDKKIRVIGNFKFDMSVPHDLPAWAKEMSGPMIVAGSTCKGEEEMIIGAYRENLERFPDLKLLIAPRHPERFKEAEDVIKGSGIPFIKRSELAGGRELSYGIVLLDAVGELSSVYRIADIAIVGKSFEGYGGQNPLEPAYWSKPIICGRHMENFPFIRDFYAEGAAFEVEAGGLAKKIRELLLDTEKAKTAGEKARALYLKNSGAVDRAVKIIEEYIA